MKNSSQQEDSSRESPTLEDEETKKEEETAKQGFFVCFLLLCFIISSIFCPSTQLYNPEFLPHFFSWEPSCKRLYFKGKKKEEKGLLFGTLKMFRYRRVLLLGESWQVWWPSLYSHTWGAEAGCAEGWASPNQTKALAERWDAHWTCWWAAERFIRDLAIISIFTFIGSGAFRSDIYLHCSPPRLNVWTC